MLTSSREIEEAADFIYTRPWPATLKFRIDLTEFGLVMRCWRDNIDALSADDKLKFASLINPTLGSVSDKGIPISIDVREGGGNGT